MISCDFCDCCANKDKCELTEKYETLLKLLWQNYNNNIQVDVRCNKFIWYNKIQTENYNA